MNEQNPVASLEAMVYGDTQEANNLQKSYAMIMLGTMYCDGTLTTRKLHEGLRLMAKGEELLSSDMPKDILALLYYSIGIVYWDGKSTVGGTSGDKTRADLDKCVKYLQLAIDNGAKSTVNPQTDVILNTALTQIESMKKMDDAWGQMRSLLKE